MSASHVPSPRPIRAALWALAAALVFCPPARAQLESRGSRDAAGARESAAERGEPTPTLAELDAAYDRASASWMEVFGPEPFGPAAAGARQAVSALRAAGWAPRAVATVAMLDARGDAAWLEDGACRAQLNVGSDGWSPVSKALGDGGFAFQAAHELAHCLYDQTEPIARWPSQSALLDPSFPVRLTPALAAAFVRMGLAAASEDGSAGLADSYDEALADAVGASAHLRFGGSRGAVERALSLRMGAAYLAERQDAPPPAHLGGHALWISLSSGPATSLARARAMAAASVLAQGLGPRAMPRWAAALAEADPAGMEAARASARAALAALGDGRDKERDEDLYLSARSPALFVMDLSPSPEAPARAPSQATPEQAMAAWRSAAWIPCLDPEGERP